MCSKLRADLSEPYVAPCPLVSTTLGLRLSGPWGRVTGPNARIRLHRCRPRSQVKSGTIKDMGAEPLGPGGLEAQRGAHLSWSHTAVSQIPVQADPTTDRLDSCVFQSSPPHQCLTTQVLQGHVWGHLLALYSPSRTGPRPPPRQRSPQDVGHGRGQEPPCPEL